MRRLRLQRVHHHQRVLLARARHRARARPPRPRPQPPQEAQEADVRYAILLNLFIIIIISMLLSTREMWSVLSILILNFCRRLSSEVRQCDYQGEEPPPTPPPVTFNPPPKRTYISYTCRHSNMYFKVKYSKKF